MNTKVSTRRVTKRGTVHAMAALGIHYLCGLKAEEPFTWTEDAVTCKVCRRLIVGLAICKCGDCRHDHADGVGACSVCAHYFPNASPCTSFQLDHEDDDA